MERRSRALGNKGKEGCDEDAQPLSRQARMLPATCVMCACKELRYQPPQRPGWNRPVTGRARGLKRERPSKERRLGSKTREGLGARIGGCRWADPANRRVHSSADAVDRQAMSCRCGKMSPDQRASNASVTVYSCVLQDITSCRSMLMQAYYSVRPTSLSVTLAWRLTG